MSTQGKLGEGEGATTATRSLRNIRTSGRPITTMVGKTDTVLQNLRVLLGSTLSHRNEGASSYILGNASMGIKPERDDVTKIKTTVATEASSTSSHYRAYRSK